MGWLKTVFTHKATGWVLIAINLFWYFHFGAVFNLIAAVALGMAMLIRMIRNME